MGKLFLSHKSVNKNIVGWLKEQLTRYGHEPWYDADDMSAGDKLERKLLAGMKTSEGAVFFITDAYKDNKWIAAEIDYAIALTRERPDFIIIPIIYKERQKDPNPVVPDLLATYLTPTVTDKRDALLEILKRLGDERSRHTAQSEIPPTPPRPPWQHRLKRLVSRPALTHALALLIGVVLTAGVMFFSSRKQNEDGNPPTDQAAKAPEPAAKAPDEAAIKQKQPDAAHLGFAKLLDPKWVKTSLTQTAETGKWAHIYKIDGPPEGTFYLAVVEITRDLRIDNGTIAKDQTDTLYLFLNRFSLQFKAFPDKQDAVLVEPNAVVFGGLAKDIGKSMQLRIDVDKDNHLARHIFLQVTDIPSPSYRVAVTFYALQKSRLDWFI